MRVVPTGVIDASPAPYIYVGGRRVCAWIIDGFLITLLSEAWGRGLVPFYLSLQSQASATFVNVILSKPPVSQTFVATLFTFVYYVLCEWLFGMTVGKAVAGLHVVTVDGERAGFWQVVLRNVLRPVEAIGAASGLGCTVVLMSRRRQRIGDHLAGTLVAASASVPFAALDRSEARRRALACITAIPLALALTIGANYSFLNPIMTDPGWNPSSPSVYSANTSISLAPLAYPSLLLSVDRPVRGDGMLAFDMRYLVRPAAPRLTTVCHATVRMRWEFAVLWGGDWRPHDLTTRCLGQTSYVSLGD